MCKASLWATHHEIAKTGQTYGIGISGHNLPALHPQGKTATECIACVPDRTVLTLTNVPAALQAKYGIGATTTVMFVDTGDNQHDMLDIGGKKIVLGEFANCGISAYVGVKASIVPDEAEPVRQLVTAR